MIYDLRKINNRYYGNHEKHGSLYFFKEDSIMWKKLGVVSVIGSIIFGILGAICDAKDVKDRIVDLKNPSNN